MEFYQGSTKLGEDLTAPYSFSWTNVPAGAYVLTARALTSGGATGVSAPAQILVAGGTATASFVRTDTTTKGNWRTAYGGEGFAVVGDTTNYPPYAQVVTTGNGSYVWDTSPTDVRALQRAVGSGRVAATWVADNTFDIDVNVTDGQVHQVAIYCMDWDSTERVQRIDVLNAITGAVLDTRTINGFNGGQYPGLERERRSHAARHEGGPIQRHRRGHFLRRCQLDHRDADDAFEWRQLYGSGQRRPERHGVHHVGDDQQGGILPGYDEAG